MKKPVKICRGLRSPRARTRALLKRRVARLRRRQPIDDDYTIGLRVRDLVRGWSD